MNAPARRGDGRASDELRPLEIVAGAAPYAEGSALVRQGDTRVLCTATVDARVPRWLMGQGRGWVTAEYGMLPRATPTRSPREATLGKQGGRTVEIQRLIGRSLRAVVDLKALGERQIILDCDVLQADAGTRCAAITGSYVALALALDGLVAVRTIARNPLRAQVAAVSVGIVGGAPLLDLTYAEDSRADVDSNIVMTSRGEFVEVQATAEGTAFSRAGLDDLLLLAELGIDQLFAAQRTALATTRS
ncbi:MAG: ribonuclease PH [Thermomicrobiales bacterium]|nr:ribonuclease PH [Thermomicrobiales bacterium]